MQSSRSSPQLHCSSSVAEGSPSPQNRRRGLNRDDLRQIVPSWRDSRHWIPPDHINYFAMSDVKRMFANCKLDVKPFAFHALTMADYRYFPRAILEIANVSLLGHNVYAIKRQAFQKEGASAQ